MSRIHLISPEEASADVKEIYEKTLRGKPGNAQKALAYRPEMLKNFLGFYASVGRSLDRKLYEMIYLCVSLINECHYCTQHHVASSKRVGLDRRKTGPQSKQETIRASREGTGCAEVCRQADASASRRLAIRISRA